MYDYKVHLSVQYLFIKFDFEGMQCCTNKKETYTLINIFYVFLEPSVLLVTVHLMLLGRALERPPSHIRFSPSVRVFKKSLKLTSSHLIDCILSLVSYHCVLNLLLSLFHIGCLIFYCFVCIMSMLKFLQCILVFFYIVQCTAL